MTERIAPFAVVNVVCKAHCGRAGPVAVDTHVLCMALRGTLGRSTFKSVAVRTRTPRATTSLFRSGKLVSTGAHTIVEALLAMRRVMLRLMLVLDWDLDVLNVEVNNIVAHSSVNYCINLNLLGIDDAQSGTNRAKWTPDIFEGMRLFAPPTIGRDIAYVIFANGRIIGNRIAAMTRVPALASVFDAMGMHRYVLGREYRAASGVPEKAVIEAHTGRVIAVRQRNKRARQQEHREAKRRKLEASRGAKKHKAELDNPLTGRSVLAE